MVDWGGPVAIKGDFFVSLLSLPAQPFLFETFSICLFAENFCVCIFFNYPFVLIVHYFQYAFILFPINFFITLVN